MQTFPARPDGNNFAASKPMKSNRKVLIPFLSSGNYPVEEVQDEIRPSDSRVHEGRNDRNGIMQAGAKAKDK